MRRVIISYPNTDETKEAWFHVWDGHRENVYALVEFDDGTVLQPFAKWVQFKVPGEDDPIDLNWWEP